MAYSPLEIRAGSSERSRNNRMDMNYFEVIDLRHFAPPFLAFVPPCISTTALKYFEQLPKKMQIQLKPAGPVTLRRWGRPWAFIPT